jgi:hypothetical protein
LLKQLNCFSFSFLLFFLFLLLHDVDHPDKKPSAVASFETGPKGEGPELEVTGFQGDNRRELSEAASYF